MPDQIDIEILDDGTISMKTGTISQKNHFSADEFMEEITKMAGGERRTDARKKPHSLNLRARDRQVKTFQK